MTVGHSKINILIKVNSCLASRGQKACTDAGKDTLINKTGLAGFSLSEKDVANKEED